MDQNENKKIDYEYISTLRIGDLVSFKYKGSHKILKGELRGIFVFEDHCLLKVYSFFSRKEKLYYLDVNLEVEIYSKSKEGTSLKVDDSPVLYNNLTSRNPRIKKLYWLIYKIVAFVLVITFLISINPRFKIPFLSSNNYQKFLEKNITVYKLYQKVTNRIYYAYDRGENWITPVTAWNKKSGDCEEFAIIMADYMTRHGIENYIVGLSIRGSLQGHAVVFAVVEGSYIVMDGTKAAEPAGIKKLNKVNSLKEAVLLYSDLPVTVYKIPVIDGEKKVAFVIYD